MTKINTEGGYLVPNHIADIFFKIGSLSMDQIRVRDKHLDEYMKKYPELFDNLPKESKAHTDIWGTTLQLQIIARKQSNWNSFEFEYNGCNDTEDGHVQELDKLIELERQKLT